MYGGTGRAEKLTGCSCALVRANSSTRRARRSAFDSPKSGAGGRLRPLWDRRVPAYAWAVGGCMGGALAAGSAVMMSSLVRAMSERRGATAAVVKRAPHGLSLCT